MAKGIREKIKLVSSAGTGHFYTTTKNKRTKPEKLELKKFDPVVRQHVLYKEANKSWLKVFVRKSSWFLLLVLVTSIPLRRTNVLSRKNWN